MTKEAYILEQFRTHGPEPNTELIYHTPFQLLIAVMLSAQTTDKRVNQVTETLFLKIKQAADFDDWSIDAIESSIRSVNYYKSKARHCKETANMIKEKHQGLIPRSREDLELLPGVGRKTANVVLSVLYQEPTMAVDTHVFRVTKRLGLSRGKTPLAIEKSLMRRFQKNDIPKLHHWLILHGRYICKARAPLCQQCYLKEVCNAYPQYA